jgi:rhodanese-related sulfurtransferase
MANNSIGYAGDVSADETLRMLSVDKAATLIDVRTQPEWQFVGAPDLSSLGKDVVFQSWQAYPEMQIVAGFADRLGEVLRGRGLPADAPLMFLCRSGARSRSAAAEMTKAGWTRCFNVSDGFEGPLDPERRRGEVAGWKAQGLPWRQS